MKNLFFLFILCSALFGALNNGDTVAFKSLATGSFLVGQTGGGGEISVNDRVLDNTGIFIVSNCGAGPLGQPYYGLKCQNNNLYLSALNVGKSNIANTKSNVGNWEKFYLIEQNNGDYVIRASINSQYVKVNWNGINIKADSTSIGFNERFRLIYKPVDGTFGGFYGSTLSYAWFSLKPDYSGKSNQPMFVMCPENRMDQKYFDEQVRQMVYAGEDIIFPVMRGAKYNHKAERVTNIMQAVSNTGNVKNIKLAIFDDTAQIVNAKNYAKYGAESQTPPYDFVSNSSEGGYQYFWDLNWKKFYQSVPDESRFKVYGRPLIVTWSVVPGLGFKNHTNNLSKLIKYIRAKCQSEFGFNPWFVANRIWVEYDPSCSNTIDSDGIDNWHNAGPGATEYGYTLSKFGLITNATLVPMFGNSGDEEPSLHGATFNTNMTKTKGANAFFTMHEGFNDWAEYCATHRTVTGKPYLYTGMDYPNHFINITRMYSDNPYPATLHVEAEGCDTFSDTTPFNKYSNYYTNNNNATRYSNGIYRGDSVDVTYGGDNYVVDMAANEWLEWKGIPMHGSTKIYAKLACASTGKTIYVKVNSTVGSTITIPNTGSTNSYADVLLGTFNPGNKTTNNTVRFTTTTGGFNFDNWDAVR